MTYQEDLIRLRDQEIEALRNKIEELNIKIEILSKQVNYENRYN